MELMPVNPKKKEAAAFGLLKGTKASSGISVKNISIASSAREIRTPTVVMKRVVPMPNVAKSAMPHLRTGLGVQPMPNVAMAKPAMPHLRTGLGVQPMPAHPKFSARLPTSRPKVRASQFSTVTVEAGSKTATAAKYLNKANKVLAPVSVAVDVGMCGYSLYKDHKNDSTRNTVETVASITAGWAGSSGGASLGAVIGTAVCPGVGTLIGGIAGGLAVGISAVVGVNGAVNAISDGINYDIEKRICEQCMAYFKVRLYKGEHDKRFCDECLNTE